MKTFKSIFLVMGIALISLLLPSCSDDDSYSLGDMWVATATVVPQNERDYYLRLDNGDKLWPAATNYPNYRPKYNQRAFVNFTILADSEHGSLGGFTHYIKINAIHDILTKNISENKGAANDSIYGTNAVDILPENMWVGDGYLNIYFETNWGGKTPHFLNLIQPDANDPYSLEFRHNSYDDPQVRKGGGRVAFNLSTLPNTKGETVDLKVKYWSFEGVKEMTLKYNTDMSLLQSGNKPSQGGDVSNMTDVK